jgi:hypothetical protein
MTATTPPTRTTGSEPSGCGGYFIARQDGIGSPGSDTGFKARMRGWFSLIGAWARAEGSSSISSSVQPENDAGATAEIIPFPASGVAKLARLADGLRQHLSDLGISDYEPLLLKIESGSAPRLLIDSTSHVEIQNGVKTYRVVLSDVFSTRLTLETGDASNARQFVCHYIIARQADAGARGVGL